MEKFSQKSSRLFKYFLVRVLPSSSKNKYGFAFLVHARDINDIYRKYPLLKIFPDRFVELFAEHMWPVVVSEATGLKSLKSGEEVGKSGEEYWESGG